MTFMSPQQVIFIKSMFLWTIHSFYLAYHAGPQLQIGKLIMGGWGIAINFLQGISAQHNMGKYCWKIYSTRIINCLKVDFDKLYILIVILSAVPWRFTIVFGLYRSIYTKRFILLTFSRRFIVFAADMNIPLCLRIVIKIKERLCYKLFI